MGFLGFLLKGQFDFLSKTWNFDLFEIWTKFNGQKMKW